MSRADVEAVLSGQYPPVRNDNGVSARHSSASNSHYTPPEIVAAARATLGGTIDLDPASCEKANAIVGAGRYFSAEDNGFTKAWWGRVLLNPPGGRCDDHGRTVTLKGKGQGFIYADGSPCTRQAMAAAKLWWWKLANEYRRGRVEAAIFVAFSLELLQVTQCKAPVGLPLPLDFPICFPSSRVAYLHEEGESLVIGGQPPHASCIVYLPPQGDRAGVLPAVEAEGVERFREAFAGIGAVR